MATYASILTKAEDAFHTAFLAIADADLIAGVTIYKGASQSEFVPPFLLIEAVSAEPFAASAPTAKGGEFYGVTVQVTAATHGEDSTRTAHGNIAGLVEAVMCRSADQMVTQLESAAITDFEAVHYRVSGMAAQMMDSLRTTTTTAVIGCVSR